MCWNPSPHPPTHQEPLLFRCVRGSPNFICARVTTVPVRVATELDESFRGVCNIWLAGRTAFLNLFDVGASSQVPEVDATASLPEVSASIPEVSAPSVDVDVSAPSASVDVPGEK